jgi:hypothetical protein
MLRIIMIGLAGAVIVFIPTFMLNKIFKEKWYIKYIPASLVFILILVSLYLAFTSHRGFEDLGYLVLSMLLFVCFMFNVVGLVILDFRRIKEFFRRIFSKMCN